MRRLNAFHLPRLTIYKSIGMRSWASWLRLLNRERRITLFSWSNYLPQTSYQIKLIWILILINKQIILLAWFYEIGIFLSNNLEIEQEVKARIFSCAQGNGDSSLSQLWLIQIFKLKIKNNRRGHFDNKPTPEKYTHIILKKLCAGQ